MNRYKIPSIQEAITEKDAWPCWPLLPIKNRTGRRPGEFPRLGALVDYGEDGFKFVADVNVWDSEALKTKLATAQAADVAALEAAGWVVD